MKNLLDASIRRMRPGPEDATVHGQSLVEYSLLLGLVVFVCIAGLTSLGQAIITKLYSLTANMF